MSIKPVVIASGGANLASLCFAIERLGHEPQVTQDPALIAAASHVLLPGVGAAKDAMVRLAGVGLTDVIPTLTQPVLGICLGMQLLCESSEEDDATCLGVIPGRATRFRFSEGYPVPQMGWNRLENVTDNPLVHPLPSNAYCYFVHSYAVPPGVHTVAQADYQGAFSAAVAAGNFFGTQFHPERSGAAGRQILENFFSLR